MIALKASIFKPKRVILSLANCRRFGNNPHPNPTSRGVVKQMLLGIIVVDAAAVFSTTAEWQATLIVVSMLVPAVALGKIVSDD
jgi:hypothetical protein